jgi:hypothetical protein
MFAEEDWEEIIGKISGMDGTCLEVIIRTPFGPTAIERNFKKGLRTRGIDTVKTINWWSGASSFGVLEIEVGEVGKIYAVWSKGEDNELVKVMPREKMDLQYILDSMASSNVAPGVMRTFSHARFPGG